MERWSIARPALWIALLNAALVAACNALWGIDEPRVYGAALTEAWIMAEYRDLAETGELYRLGPEESAP